MQAVKTVSNVKVCDEIAEEMARVGAVSSKIYFKKGRSIALCGTHNKKWSAGVFFELK